MSQPYIVIVEDNPADIELLRIALDHHREPYELVALTDGEEALRFVKERSPANLEPEPCIILLDFHLPKLDGPEVLAAVKREPSLRHVHVMMLTSGGVRPQEQARVESMGATFRLKPRNFSEVLALAADILALCKGVASLKQLA
ncbi:MAG: response regulator [Bryobacterales bacterium]|nr:response regulator [Bryobacterales bacterium]MBV9399767.1 response regulator [Bryobacterales bacterium]